MDKCVETAASWMQWHPQVGVFIGVLALLGVVVPWLFRPPDKMDKPEKAFWTGVMLLLLGLELRTLHLDRNEHDREQALANCRQLENFRSIAETLGNAVNQAKGQYESTIGHVDGVLKTTQEVSTLAKHNLEEITGGESFGYVIPGTADGSPIVMILHNDGDHQLSGVKVRILYIPFSCQVWGKLKSCMEQQVDLSSEPLDMGTLAPKTTMRVPHFYDTQVHPDGTAHYRIEIRAQNGIATENIWFRPSSAKSGTAYRFDVFRTVTGTRRRGDIRINGVFHRELKIQNWTDIPPMF